MMKYEEEVEQRLSVDQLALFRDKNLKQVLECITQVAPLYGGNPILQALHLLLEEHQQLDYFKQIVDGGPKIWEIVAIIANVYHHKEFPQKKSEVDAQGAYNNAWVASQAFHAFVGALQREQEPLSASQLREFLETAPKNPAKFYANIPEINKKFKIKLPSAH